MTKSSDIAGHSTGIGSLPPAEEKEVLDQAFAVDIPYFPSLPATGENETLLGQGLAGFPDLAPDAFSPGQLWKPFLERLTQDPRPWTKLQIVGPVTAAKGRGFSPARPGSGVLADWLSKRAEWMLEQVQSLGKKAIFFFDEPALLDEEPSSDLKLTVEKIRERGALAGIHCCAAGDFDAYLNWPLDFLSFDFSLASPWEDAERLWVFRQRGGRLSLGVIPTALTPDWHPRKEVERCRSRLRAALGSADAEEVLRESMLTPACGLGLRTLEESAAVFRTLADFQDCLRR